MARMSAQARSIFWTRFNQMFKNNLLPLCGDGAPTDGASGTGANARGSGGPGCQYTDYTNGYVWVNEGTHASPTWGFLGTQVTT